ncbi:MAG: L-seryl-tRNA(Sec) selenium transferase [Deltaproteobacteria bacterium]|jgi:L-seryl-tRNA(Ser) seleniumtransferase|nr:L-seryl-tRNA(Sec) selenium transferase [Deltaproteobacteria bacterium]
MEARKNKKGGTVTAKQELLRAIPQVDEVLQWFSPETDGSMFLIKQSVREELESLRQSILAGKKRGKNDLAKKRLRGQIHKRLQKKLGPNFKRVINATGVVIHTNLGRSILPDSAREALVVAGTRYSNLEFDLATGKRGSRYSLVEQLLCDLTGAEAGLVVNNNAAAVLLVLDTLAKGREVIVSRGQLVEIGGSFRVPDVMAKSGAKLVEVGATNRTHLKDYEGAITEETAMLLKVHASNFKMVGFTKEVPAEELVELAERYKLLVMEDLGSGCLIDMSRYGLRKEPTVQEMVKAGVDVVTFSGDKLLGGPQAGLIVGKRNIIDCIKRNQLNRALRIDKFTLAALETVLRLYYDQDKAVSSIPTLSMLSAKPAIIERRAKSLARKAKKMLAGKCNMKVSITGSRVGGGALPEEDLESRAVVLEPLDRTVNELEKNLRHSRLPVIGRIEEDRFILDMRTVGDDEVPIIVNILAHVFGVNV